MIMVFVVMVSMVFAVFAIFTFFVLSFLRRLLCFRGRFPLGKSRRANEKSAQNYGQEPLLAILPGIALTELWQIVGVAEVRAVFRIDERANFIVLDRDITAIPPNEIHKTIVLETWFGGRRVYSGSEKVSF